MPVLLKNFHSIRWLIAELFIIILGITIAFQVEEWRSERAERREENEVLQSMLTDFEIAAEQFGRYLSSVDEHYYAIRELRGHLRSNTSRSDEKLTEIVSTLGGGYLWQATDSTWQSVSPSIISDAILRRDLIEFHDGFMPFMLSQSNRYQANQTVFRDVLFDDFEAEFIDMDEPYLKISIVSPIDEIPTHKEFYEKRSNFESSLRNLKNRIPEALERIRGLESRIRQHLQTL